VSGRARARAISRRAPFDATGLAGLFDVDLELALDDLQGLRRVPLASPLSEGSSLHGVA